MHATEFNFLLVSTKMTDNETGKTLLNIDMINGNDKHDYTWF